MPEETFFDRKSAEFKRASHHFIKSTVCGHREAEASVWDFWGNVKGKVLKEEFIRTLRDERVIDFECQKCFFEKLKKSAIRCALCGIGIVSGDTVALYAKESEVVNPKFATYIGDSVIGCTFMGCGLAAALAGTWTEKGFEPINFCTF